MTIFSFTEKFGSEEDYLLHFKQERDKQGVFCKKCACSEHYWFKE